MLRQIGLIGFCLIIGGGIANIYDRILYGSVTDFLFIDLGGIFKTGIFNIADLSVTTGMLLFLLKSKEKYDLLQIVAVIAFFGAMAAWIYFF